MLPIMPNPYFRITASQVERFIGVVVKLFVIIAVGITYAKIIQGTGISIPCPFRTITGFKCPGCGITHMCMAIMAKDFQTAWSANPILAAISPAIIYLLAKQIVVWVAFGKRKMSKTDKSIANVLVIILLSWGIIRNIIGV